MYSYRIVCALVALTIGVAVMAQNNTNSPYTRYGLGELREPGFGRSQAMGGIGFGVRDHASINPANPASYSAIDSMTFLFDLGVSGLASHFNDATGSRNTHNGNLDYLAMQMPLSKFMGASIGIIPYSFTGYDYSLSGTTKVNFLSDSTINNTQNYNGTGGISQIYGGLSFRLFDHISLGANAIYLFGSNSYNRAFSIIDVSNTSLTTHPTSEKINIDVNSFNVRLGAQVFGKISKKGYLTVGAMFEPKMNLHGTYDKTILGLDSTKDALAHSFETPMQFGIGTSYTYDNRLTLGADFLYQNWSDAKYFGQTGALKNRTKISVGGEYIDNPYGKTYFQRMSFRFGAYYSDSYINVNGYSPSQMAVTCGFGFPLRSSRSMINTSFEYGVKGKSTTTSIKENYFRFTLGLSLNEIWFLKRKL